jgi:Holliday junction resolvase RusA-like endonuclease|tara:strand:+ start:1545 stop:1994 length:450 start_codon:yes stop_codon:yes gene_type:complete
MIKLICPLAVYLPRVKSKDKRIAINLNTYRNLHHIINNQAKKAYLNAVREQIEGLTIQTPVEVTYKVYKASKRRLDKMNVISVTSKYLMDAITELGCWTDDDDENIKTEIILPTELDGENPRVEVFIKCIDERFRKDSQESQAMGEDGN